MWQPIETAPRDGTWILLAGGTIDCGWDSEQRPHCVVGQFLAAAQPQCWQFAWYDSGYYGEYDRPTHWMSLPEPPSPA
jgi:hypothetical protein